MTGSMNRIRAGVVLVAGAMWLATATTAAAATFTVNPTQIFLAGKTTTVLLTLKNESDEPLRFQLSAFAWQQSPSGELSLTPTQDVVFFPALLTLGPGEERRIRVGSTVTAASQERTYRIFVEELPPMDAPAAGAAVRVLTRMGVPIFIRPSKETASANLHGLELRNGVLHFVLANGGTVHFVPQKVLVRGTGTGGERSFEHEVQAWYVLAGGRREFDVALPASACGGMSGLAVDVQIGSMLLKETLQTPGGACAR
jgi:fimbrial chaperone protein